MVQADTRASGTDSHWLDSSLREKVLELALDEPELSPREVAVTFTDRHRTFVSEASVGKNLVMKRFMARARGRGAGIQKPFAQITIVVEEKREEKTVDTKTKGKPKRSAKKPVAKSAEKESA